MSPSPSMFHYGRKIGRVTVQDLYPQLNCNIFNRKLIGGSKFKRTHESNWIIFLSGENEKTFETPTLEKSYSNGKILQGKNLEPSRF